VLRPLWCPSQTSLGFPGIQGVLWEPATVLPARQKLVVGPLRAWSENNSKRPENMGTGGYQDENTAGD